MLTLENNMLAGAMLELPVPWVKVAYEGIIEANSVKDLATYGSLIVLVASYFLFSLPSSIFQFIRSMDRFKLQPSKNATMLDHWTCIKLVVWSHAALFYPLIFSLWAYGSFDALKVSWISVPSWPQMTFQLIVALMIEDTWHYFLHRLLHHRSIYGFVHKWHHTWTAPFSFTAEYAHPIESAVLGVGFFIPLAIFGDHLTFWWWWLVVRLLETCDVHSGYALWWSPLHLLPFYGGARFHDFHHKAFTSNFASTFTYWDALFGTDKEFRKTALEHSKEA